MLIAGVRLKMLKPAHLLMTANGPVREIATTSMKKGVVHSIMESNIDRAHMPGHPTVTELAKVCDEMAGDWVRVWELGREATGKPGGPDEEEVEAVFDKAFAWHHLAETLRKTSAG